MPAYLLKIASVLTPRERRAAVALMAIMLISMALEMIGIGIIVPGLGILAAGPNTTATPETQAWLAFVGNPSQKQLILSGIAALLAVYGLKALFLLYAGWKQAQFTSRLQSRIAAQLFSTYLAQPWPFHLNRNSAELIRNINETSSLSASCSSILSMIAESLVFGGVLGLLVWYEPIGAVSVGVVLGIATWILQSVTQGRLQRWGGLYWGYMNTGNRLIQEGLQGAKDIKVLGCEETLISRFHDAKTNQAIYGTRQLVCGQIPRLWFEVIAVVALCVLTAILLQQGRSLKDMIPILGLFAAAAFRLLPSVNRLVTGLQSIRFTNAIVSSLHADLMLPAPPFHDRAVPPMSFCREVVIQNLSYRYPLASSNAADGVSLRIPHGSSVGLIGGSGAGKSTLVDIILGLLTPTSGKVLVDGVDIQTNVRGWQSIIGYVPQTIFLADDTLRRNVAFGLPEELIDDEAVRRALRAAQLESFVAELPEGWNTGVGERGVRLSGGQRQRIGIARALYHDPQVLVLDEATSALDMETEAGVMADVESLHGAKTLIIVAHRLSTVRHCDMLYRLERGRIAQAGSFAEVIGS